MSSSTYITKQELAKSNEKLRRSIRDTIKRNMNPKKKSEKKTKKTRDLKKSPLKTEKKKKKKKTKNGKKTKSEPKIVHFVARGKKSKK